MPLHKVRDTPGIKPCRHHVAVNLAQPRASSVTLDRAAGIATRAPLIAGFVLIGLGVWSIAFALEADLEAWRL